MHPHRRRLTTRLAAFAILLSNSLGAWAGWPSEVAAFRDALDAVETADPPVEMESLFLAATALQQALMRGDPVTGRVWLQDLDGTDIAALSDMLRGMRLARGPIPYALPDALFLSELAQRQGRPEDRRFFRYYRQSWGLDPMPAWLRRTSRVLPCIRYGEGVMGDLYEAWLGFARDYPAAYIDYVRLMLGEIEQAVAQGGCACGGEDTVEQELSEFVTRFPNTQVRPAILARLQELEDDPERRPVQCR
ncbi:MAG: hypothetical protein ACREUE_00980 [Panacagrimonas sp.]